MKATITSIELRGPLNFFALSSHALKILKQLKATNYKDFKKRGIWTKHYTDGTPIFGTGLSCF